MYEALGMCVCVRARDCKFSSFCNSHASFVFPPRWFADAPTTPEEKKKIRRINDFWKPFYFRWVETFLEKRSGEDLGKAPAPSVKALLGSVKVLFGSIEP